MTRTRIAALSALLVFALAPGAAAQNSGTQLLPESDLEATRTGTRGANFLKQGVGARALALGGAYSALSTGVYSLYWNPGGLAHTEGFAAAYSYAALFEDADITHHFMGVVLPALGGTIGLSGIFFDSGDIPRTTSDFPRGGDPTFGDSFNWTGTAIGLHYGRLITDRLSVGAAGKFVSEGIADAEAQYVGFDAGVLFDTGIYGTRLGAAVTNIGSEGRMRGGAVNRRLAGENTGLDILRDFRINLETESFALPSSFHFGIRTSLVGGPTAVLAPNPSHNLIVAAQVDDAIDGPIQPALGLEYAFRDLFYLRGGKRAVNEERDDSFRSFSHGLSAGLGVQLPIGEERFVGFDYAWVDMGELENVQVLSFDLHF